MRSKESAHDYRYFPEPDLLNLVVEPGLGRRDPRARLPELPAGRRARFERDYGLSPYDADVLTQRKDVADYFEAGVAAGAPAKDMANWTLTEILRIVRDEKLDHALVIRDWPIAGDAAREAHPPRRRRRHQPATRRRALSRDSAARTTDPAALVAAEGVAPGERPRARSWPPSATSSRAIPTGSRSSKPARTRCIGFFVGQAG